MEKIKKDLWPGWETVQLIGRGSFGSVYEIERDVLGEKEKAALKVISIPERQSDIEEMYSEGYNEQSVTEAFKEHLRAIVSEYTLMRKMNGCANVVNCDDVQYFQHKDGIGWDIMIKMELLTPLNKTLTDEYSEQMVLSLAIDLCNALVLCDKNNIIHRDIKPQNIFISPNGDYKLGDFGIAKSVEKTMGGTKIGTYKYMAPEVFNNKPYGLSADIYSLGLVLYWLLNERRGPFLPLPPQAPTASVDEEARRRRFAGEPIPPPKNGSYGLQQIVLKACSYEPKDRYRSAQEMLTALWAMSDATSDAAPADRSSFAWRGGVVGSDVPNNMQQPDLSVAGGVAFEQESTIGGPNQYATGIPGVEQPPVVAFNPEWGENGNVPDTYQVNAEPEGNKKKKQIIWLLATAVSLFAIIVIGLVMLLSGKDDNKKNNDKQSDDNVKVVAAQTSIQAATVAAVQPTTATEAPTTQPKQLYLKDMRWSSMEELKAYCAGMNLAITTESQNNDYVDSGYIIDTVPAAGAWLNEGDSLHVYISLGKKAVAHSYKLYKDDCTWAEARQNCIAMGGHLATITSVEEEKTILEMTVATGAKFVWLGGYTQIDAYGNILGYWVTGEQMMYSDWLGPYEPSGMDQDGTLENCMLLWHVEKYESYGLPGYDGWGWNDTRNDLSAFSNYMGNLWYICEFGDSYNDLNVR